MLRRRRRDSAGLQQLNEWTVATAVVVVRLESAAERELLIVHESLSIIPSALSPPSSVRDSAKPSLPGR